MMRRRVATSPTAITAISYGREAIDTAALPTAKFLTPQSITQNALHHLARLHRFRVPQRNPLRNDENHVVPGRRSLRACP